MQPVGLTPLLMSSPPHFCLPLHSRAPHPVTLPRPASLRPLHALTPSRTPPSSSSPPLGPSPSPRGHSTLAPTPSQVTPLAGHPCRRSPCRRSPSRRSPCRRSPSRRSPHLCWWHSGIRPLDRGGFIGRVLEDVIVCGIKIFASVQPRLGCDDQGPSDREQTNGARANRTRAQFLPAGQGWRALVGAGWAPPGLNVPKVPATPPCAPASW